MGRFMLRTKQGKVIGRGMSLSDARKCKQALYRTFGVWVNIQMEK